MSDDRDRARRSTAGTVVLVAYVVGMMVAFLAPVPVLPLTDTGGIDKSVHLLLFAGFAFLYRAGDVASMVATLLVSTAFAAAIEVVQSMIWYRSGDVWDVVAGVIGATAGSYLAHHITQTWRRASDSAR